VRVTEVYFRSSLHRLRNPQSATCQKWQRRRAGLRTGAAALEAAISVPLIVTIIFGAIELSNAIFLRQSLNMAAYEAAKVVTRPGTNETLARDS
jgi:Flp pilus assembly protein TadG